jgi:ribokinase
VYLLTSSPDRAYSPAVTREPALLIVGDIGVDLVLGPIAEWPRVGTETLVERSELRAGGCAGNAALAVRWLGGEARLLSGVGNDDFGAWLAKQFDGLDALLPVLEVPTTLSVGVLHQGSERSFFTTRGHLEQLSHATIAEGLARATGPGAIALLCGGFLLPALRPAYPSLIAQLRALGYRIALDTGWPPAGWSADLRHEVEGWVRDCDHVLLNELEVSELAAESDVDAAAKKVARLLKPGASLIVKTGARGARGFEDGRAATSPAGVAEIFDTVGAGDSFNAGYLLARLRGASLGDALAAGCRAATSIIARFPRREIGPGELATPAAPVRKAAP